MDFFIFPFISHRTRRIKGNTKRHKLFHAEFAKLWEVQGNANEASDRILRILHILRKAKT